MSGEENFDKNIKEEWIGWIGKHKALYARHCLIMGGNGSHPISHYLGKEVPGVCPTCGRPLLDLKGIEKPADSKVVIGRDEEVREIIDALGQGHNILLSGEKGVGKTAVLDKIARYFRDKRRKVVFIENSKNWGEAYVEAFKQLHKYGDVSFFEDEYAAELERDELKQLVSSIPGYDRDRALARNLYDKRYLVIIDGMEHANKTVFYKLNSIIRYVLRRREREKKKGIGCQLVIATNDVKRDGEDVWVWCKEVPIEPLDREETGELFDILLKDRGIRYEDREMTRNQVILQSGGLPMNVIASANYIIKESGGGRMFTVDQTRELNIGLRPEFRSWALMLYFIISFAGIMILRRLTGEINMIMVVGALVIAFGMVMRRVLIRQTQVRD